MFTLLSYFAFLMLALTFTLALFVGLNKSQILQFVISSRLIDCSEGRKRRNQNYKRVFYPYQLLICRTYQQLITD
nr:cytochrome b6/f complex 3.5 kDa subunit [Adiantum reniforme var. sinense]UNZ94146.1 cytochrome b6/f complex 3.5 kDa subunit [Adiantum reniforme var. sinense]